MKRPLSFYTIFFIVCMVVMRVSGILSKIVLARAITPYEYGIITLIIISFPNVFQLLTNFCLHDLLSHSRRGRKYFGFSIFYSVFVSILIGAVVFIFHNQIFDFLNLPLKNWHVLFMGFFIVLISNAILVDMTGILRGLKRYSQTTILASLPSVLKLFLILIAVYLLNIRDFCTLLLIFAISPLIVLIGISIKEWRKLFKYLKNINIPSKDMFLFGISIFTISLFGGLNQAISKIIVSHDLGIEYQGYFDISFTLVTLLGFSFAAMQFISIPEATGARNKRDLLFKTGGLGDISRALFSFLLFGVILLYFYSYQFVDLLFSHRYTIAANYVPILAVGYIFLFVQQFLAYVNISLSEDIKGYKQLIFITLLLLIISPFVTHMLIQSSGFIGAYISIVLFLFLYSLITIILLRDISPLYALLFKIERLILSILITFLFLMYFQPPFIIGILISFILYISIIFLSGYLKKELISDLFTYGT